MVTAFFAGEEFAEIEEDRDALMRDLELYLKVFGNYLQLCVEQGERSLYCERVAPGETERTCRLMGARAVFEKKIQDEDTWKIYKRAYKKYYARFMKGNMSETEFKAWAVQAAADRDAAIEKVKVALDENLKAQVIDQLREELNRQ